MGLKDIHEHIACVNYEDASAKANKKPIIEVLKVLKGRVNEKFLSEAKIILVVQGKFSVSYEKYVDKTVPAGKMILLPPSCQYKARAEEDASIVVFRLRNKIELCDRVGLEQLYNKIEDTSEEFNPLDINEQIQIFLNGLKVYITDGLKCHYYFELKIREFFYLMRAYYTKEELAGFFHPILSNDKSFSDFVYNNHYKVKTVQDLAALSNYSYSGFIKRFKKTFGIAAYQWMKQQKATRILHDINCSDKTIKQICDDYDFNSLSQFNDFCKSNFGNPPSKIRKSKMF